MESSGGERSAGTSSGKFMGRTDAEKTRIRKQWNVKHSRKSRQRVSQALDELTKVVEVVDDKQPQAEVLTVAAELIQSLYLENLALGARWRIATDRERAKNSQALLGHTRSPVSAVTELLKLLVTTGRCTLAELWRRDEGKKRCWRVTSAFRENSAEVRALEPGEEKTLIPHSYGNTLVYRAFAKDRDERDHGGLTARPAGVTCVSSSGLVADKSERDIANTTTTNTNTSTSTSTNTNINVISRDPMAVDDHQIQDAIAIPFPLGGIKFVLLIILTKEPCFDPDFLTHAKLALHNLCHSKIELDL